jgi:hypothetical protein
MRETAPKEFTVGESLEWTVSFDDYPASDGWILTYYFRGAGTGFNASAAADGDDHLIEVAKTATAALTAGKYSYQAFAELGEAKVLVDVGEAIVKESLAALSTGTAYDARSQVKIILDNIDAMIAGKATLDQQEYSIGTRQLRRIPLPDLIALRKEYARLYAAEQRAEKLKNGGSLIRNHKVRFRNPR